MLSYLCHTLYPALCERYPELAPANLLHDYLAVIFALLGKARGLNFTELREAWQFDLVAECLPLTDWEQIPPHLPGAVYQQLMTGQHQQGSYYTPALLADDTADRTLSPLLIEEGAPDVLDPSSGSGLRSPLIRWAARASTWPGCLALLPSRIHSLAETGDSMRRVKSSPLIGT